MEELPLHDSLDREGNQRALFCKSKQHLEAKDFITELRSRKDILSFCDENSQEVVLLDIQETSAQQIAIHLLDELEAIGKINFHIKSIILENILTSESVPQYVNTIHSSSQTFVVAHCEHSGIPKKAVALARLVNSINMGSMSHLCRFVVLVVGPVKEKGTKKVLETATSFASLLNSPELRFELINAKSIAGMKSAMHAHISVYETGNTLDIQPSELKASSSVSSISLSTESFAKPHTNRFTVKRFFSQMFSGIVDDLHRRVPYYWSDYRDGFVGPKTWQKTLSTTVFLYFACLLPAVAFGVLNASNTRGAINVQKTIFAQMFGGLVFAVFGGQPLTVLLTTAPISLYIKVVQGVCTLNNLDFFAMYAWVGLWTGLFLILFSISNLSVLMRYSSKFTEETFGLFITIAFCYDSIKPLVLYFQANYCSDNMHCSRDSAILYLLLMLSTLVIGLQFYRMKFSVVLNATLRTILADYSLPLAVLITAFFGSYVFRLIYIPPFAYSPRGLLKLSDFWELPVWAILLSGIFGLMLSLLFFMDQNISSAMANSKVIIAFINIFLSIFGLPWVHGAIPHSPLHVKALADTEKVYSHGHLYERIVRPRETRVTGIATHALLGVSLLMLPLPLKWLPVPVLYGVFLYLAFTALPGNEFYERILLLVTEQANYPPTSYPSFLHTFSTQEHIFHYERYLRRVPQRKVHLFTLFQLLWLAVLCIIGFFPYVYVQMTFGLFLILLLVVRHKLAPKLFESKHLAALDP